MQSKHIKVFKANFMIMVIKYELIVSKCFNAYCSQSFYVLNNLFSYVVIFVLFSVDFSRVVFEIIFTFESVYFNILPQNLKTKREKSCLSRIYHNDLLICFKVTILLHSIVFKKLFKCFFLLK